MDLGSLELQIFVSLTVVLGGAFVALVCDYLKGNNEQLREHNIELRVRKEEQDRIMLLDPAGFLRQAVPQPQSPAVPIAAAKPTPATRPAAPHEVMQSFATPDALSEADARAAALQARSQEEDLVIADVPPMTTRRNQRSNRKSNRGGSRNGEQYADWVRPEVIARVARRAEASEAFHSDIREEIEAVKAESQQASQPAPLNAAENWDIRDHLVPRERASRPPAAVEPAPAVNEVVAVPVPAPETAPVEAAPVVAAPVEAAAVEAAVVEVAVVEPAAVTETVLVEALPAVAAPAAEPQPVARLAADPVPPQVEVLTSETRLGVEEAAYLQREIEKVAQLQRQPAAPAPGTILRPLTIPALRLEEELQRVSEETESSKPAAASAITPLWHSPLLDEVIAASANRSPKYKKELPREEVPVADLPAPIAEQEPVPAPEPILVAEEPLPAEPVAVTFEEAPVGVTAEAATPVISDIEPTVPVEPVPAESWLGFAPPMVMPEDTVLDVPSADPILQWLEIAPVEAPPEVAPAAAVQPEAPPSASEILAYYSFAPHHSALAGAGVLPPLDYLAGSASVETPIVRLPLLAEPALAGSEELAALATDDVDLALPELLPLEDEEPAAPPLWKESVATADTGAAPAAEVAAEVALEMAVAAPIDISAARTAEPEPVAAPPAILPSAPSHPDLLLPTGMHDFSTWARLLSLPNPMTGILFLISLHNNEDSSLPDRKGVHIGEEHAPAIDRLMSSFVREGDFGSRISDREWVFIYSNDVAGFNQRRVGMISEKLWDFQLRHLGLARITFRWGAIDVQREPLAAATNAARERMNQTRRTKKLPGSGLATPRQAVNA